MPDRERPQQHRIHEAEDRCVGADAERERQHAGGGESRRAAQPAHAITQVAEQIVNQSHLCALEPRQNVSK